MQQSLTAPSPPPRAVEPLPSREVVGEGRSLRRPEMRDFEVCGLCGDRLQGAGPHARVRSPYDAEQLLVCGTCRRAACGEGYLPTA